MLPETLLPNPVDDEGINWRLAAAVGDTARVEGPVVDTALGGEMVVGGPAMGLETAVGDTALGGEMAWERPAMEETAVGDTALGEEMAAEGPAMWLEMVALDSARRSRTICALDGGFFTLGVSNTRCTPDRKPALDKVGGGRDGGRGGEASFVGLLWAPRSTASFIEGKGEGRVGEVETGGLSKISCPIVETLKNSTSGVEVDGGQGAAELDELEAEVEEAEVACFCPGGRTELNCIFAG